jgi:hypothetical protein
VTVAVFIGDVTDIADEVDTHQPRGTDSHRKELIAALPNMSHYAGFQDLMIFPVSVILLNDLGHHLFIIWGSNIRSSHV